MSGLAAAEPCDRHALAALLARHVAAADERADRGHDQVALAAADRLGRWADALHDPADPIAAWSRPASVVVCEEFLAPSEIAALSAYVLSRRRDFQAGTLVHHDTPGVYVDRSFRAAETLFDLQAFRDLFAARIDRYLPFICARLGLPPFGRHGYEFQLAAIPDGGFFRQHDDNSHPANRTRRLTCVFYFFCSPLRPEGGELRFAPEHGWNGPRLFRPVANRILFFDSSVPHEVLPVRGRSDRFEAARFTVNGWIHQDRG